MLRFKSVTIRRTRYNCCASFCPKTAASGLTRLNSFNTTVRTPWKNPGLKAPSSDSPTRPGSTVTSCSVGYICVASGAKTRWAPCSAQMATSRPRSRGYLSRAAPTSNCSGLTKTDTTSEPSCPEISRPRRSSARCPSCSAPMVGTRTTGAPMVARAVASPSMDLASMGIMESAPKGHLVVVARHRRPASEPRAPAQPSTGRARGRRRVPQARPT